MEGFNFKFLNDIQEPDDVFSYFQTANIFSIECPSIIDLHDIKVYRGLHYSGLSVNKNLICFDSNGENDGYIKLENEVQMLSCTVDGSFLLLLTKNNSIYLIYTPTKRIIYKKEIRTDDGVFIKKAIILEVDNSTSEIWIFLNEAVTIYRNVDFGELEKALLCDNNNRKIELLSQIKIEDSSFPFLKRDGQLIYIQVLKSKKCNQFFMALLYANNLVVLTGFVDKKKSYVDCFYETDISHFDIDVVNAENLRLELSPDEMHIFFIDANGVLWIFNFIMGRIFQRLRNENGLFTDVSICPGHIIVSKNLNKDQNSIDILTFPSLKSIGSFAISSRSIIYPIPDENEPILVLDGSDIEPKCLMLKSICRLDADVRLKEIIATNNFEYAFKFAGIFNLDKEPIYIHQLKHLVQVKKVNGALSDEEYISLYICMKEIKNFFELELFEFMLLFVMQTVEEHGFILEQLKVQTQKAPESNEQTSFSIKIEKEIYQFQLFKIFSSKPNFTMEKWMDFRNMNKIDILYILITRENINLMDSVWPLIMNGIDEVFQCNEIFCKSVTKLCKEMIAQRQKVSDFENIFQWVIHQLFVRQVNVRPNQLSNMTTMFENIIRQLEATNEKCYRQMCIKFLNEAVVQFNNIRIESSTAIKKANVETAGLFNFAEGSNHVLSLSKLHKELILLNKLYDDYNLDLNLHLLKEESQINLASRLLDQISTNDLTNELPKLKKFLEDFKLRSCEFFHSYIKKLSTQFSSNIVDDLENRFTALLPNIEDKQIRLDCLETFASNANVPFKDVLSSVIIKEIELNSPSNPSVKRLRLLQRKSNITPIFNRYSIKYAKLENIIPERIILLILLLESPLSPEIIETDVKEIAKLYNLDELSITKVRCKAYVRNIVATDDLVASTNLSKLKTIINCPTYPRSTFAILVDVTFEYLMCLWREQMCMSYCDLMFVLDVAHWLANMFDDETTRNSWIAALDVMQFCISIGYDPSEESISLTQFFGIDCCPLVFIDGQLGHIKSHISRNIRQVIKTVTVADNYNYAYIDKAIWNSIDGIMQFGITTLRKADTFVIEMCQEVFQEIITESINNDQFLSLCLIYSHLHLVTKFGIKEPIYQQKTLIFQSLECIQDIDLSDNAYTTWSILELLSTILKLFIHHNMGYLYENFTIMSSIVSFLTVIVRSFAELEVLSSFDIIMLPYTYQEIPTSVDSFGKFIPLIKSGFDVICSMHNDNFKNKIIIFNQKIFESLNSFCYEGLLITGFIAGINLLSITVDENNCQKLHTILVSNKFDSIFGCTLDSVFKCYTIDQPFALGILLCLPRRYVVNKLKSELKSSKSSRKMLAVYTVTTELLLFNINFFDDNEKKSYFNSILSGARLHYWGNRLKTYKIPMFRTCDEKHIMATRLEILQHPNTPLELVDEFLCDFGMWTKESKFQSFQDLFSLNFHDCHNMDSYKKKIENVLKRADKLWSSIPVEKRTFFNVTKYLGNITHFTSPYHYEILDYIYSIMHTVTFEHNNESQMIKQLYLWPRLSKMSDEERLTCARAYDPLNIPNSSTATFLAETRLPFDLFIDDDPMKVLELELSDSNVDSWLDMYKLLKKLKSVDKRKINHDLLQLKTAENIFKDFIFYNQSHDVVKNDQLSFMGNDFDISSSWFGDIVKGAMSFLNRLLNNTSFIDFIDKRLNELSMREHRTYLLNASMQWLSTRLAGANCNGAKKLLEWKKQKLLLKERMEVEKILDDYKLYKSEYLELIPDWRLLLETILHLESMNWKLTLTEKQNIVSAIKEISQLTSIDMDEFSFCLVSALLKFSCNDTSMSSSGDHESSMLNVSMDGSMCDNKPTLNIDYTIDTIKIELLSMDACIKDLIKTNLLNFINTNSLTLEQWMHVFVYLFRCHRPDEHAEIDSLRNRNTFALFLIMLELLSLDLGPSPFVDCNRETLLTTLSNFRELEKTEFVRRIYCGDKCKKGSLKADHKVDNRTLSVLKDLIFFCPESIKLNDEVIETIIATTVD